MLCHDGVIVSIRVFCNSARASEVRPIGVRDWRQLRGMGGTVIAEVEMAIAGALRTSALHQLSVVSPRSFEPGVSLYGVPRRSECAGILDVNQDFHGLAAIGHTKALYDMELLGVRRAVIVDERLGVLPDGIDDQRIAFIMADGFAEPGGPRTRRMRHIHIDMPHLIVAAPDDQ